MSMSLLLFHNLGGDCLRNAIHAAVGQNDLLVDWNQRNLVQYNAISVVGHGQGVFEVISG